MTEHANHFLLLSILALGTVLIVFGMKYFSAGKQARLGFAYDGAYRGLVERTASVQTASAASLAALQADISDMKTRLAAVEKVLREVG